MPRSSLARIFSPILLDSFLWQLGARLPWSVCQWYFAFWSISHSHRALYDPQGSLDLVWWWIHLANDFFSLEYCKGGSWISSIQRLLQSHRSIPSNTWTRCSCTTDPFWSLGFSWWTLAWFDHISSQALPMLCKFLGTVQASQCDQTCSRIAIEWPEHHHKPIRELNVFSLKATCQEKFGVSESNVGSFVPCLSFLFHQHLFSVSHDYRAILFFSWLSGAFTHQSTSDTVQLWA